MVKKYIFLFLFFLPVYLNGQVTDSTQTFPDWMIGDTTWTQTINDADLILKLRITGATYVTDGGSFTYRVLQIVKGGFNKKPWSFTIGMIESSAERWDARYRAIYPKDDDWNKPYTVYAGFVKTTSPSPDLFDEKKNQGYDFLMSVERLR